MMADLDEYQARNVKLYPCKSCGRKFNAESLSKHQNICLKNSRSKRKVFDSSKQRAEGTDVTLRQMKLAQKKVIPPPKTHWREKHEDFIRTVKQARGVTVALKTGGPLPEHIPSANPDYVQCPHCSRRFNEKAAERHINWCKTQLLKKGPVPNANAKAKMDARNKYQPPKLKPRNPGTAATSSPSYGGARSPASGGSSGRGPAPSGRGASGGSRMPASTTSTGMGRTPPAASNGYGRQPASGTRGRPTAGVSQPQARDFSDDGLENNAYGGTGKSIRNGSNIKTYAEARADILKNGGRPIKSKYSTTSSRGGVPGQHGTNQFSSPSTGAGSGGQGFSKGHGRDFEPGYHSNNSNYNNTQHSHRSPQGQLIRKNSSPPKFCFECGTKYPVPNAKFCCECGIRRLNMT